MHHGLRCINVNKNGPTGGDIRSENFESFSLGTNSVPAMVYQAEKQEI